MVTKEQLAQGLMERYQAKSMISRLDKDSFQSLFKEAVKDYYPKLKQQYADQSIYGISFEIANVVQRTYSEDFCTFIYLNTEEMYQESIEDCEEDEKSYYRFEAWAEWDVACTESPLFDDIQAYLQLNSLANCSNISEYQDSLSEEAAAWYEEHEFKFEESFEEEREQIRLWVADTLGELRKEGFWEKQGNAGLYVIPFGGECDVDKEELTETYREMDQDCHGTEYLDYLDTFE